MSFFPIYINFYAIKNTLFTYISCRKIFVIYFIQPFYRNFVSKFESITSI